MRAKWDCISHYSPSIGKSHNRSPANIEINFGTRLESSTVYPNCFFVSSFILWYMLETFCIARFQLLFFIAFF